MFEIIGMIAMIGVAIYLFVVGAAVMWFSLVFSNKAKDKRKAVLFSLFVMGVAFTAAYLVATHMTIGIVG